MSKVAQSEKAQFEKLLGDADRWTTIDDLVRICDEGGLWSDEFLETVTDKAKKAQLRRLIKGVKDESNWPVWASVETTNEEGETVRVYKQELLFDPEDYRKVVSYHSDRASHHGRMARGYAKRCDKRFRTRLYRQLRINFDDESMDPKKPR
ncbi:hypothetical protein LCGC14_2444600 [marine sediment metagenome]|uniref:Uncharacterized protein n=1 Tax=marine sediment metagenome TaxID=412755 RepID=A0A0F9BI58_9ZZZZ